MSTYHFNYLNILNPSNYSATNILRNVIHKILSNALNTLKTLVVTVFFPILHLLRILGEILYVGCYLLTKEYQVPRYLDKISNN